MPPLCAAPEADAPPHLRRAPKMRPQTPADGIPFLLFASKPAPAGEPPLGARCAQRLSRPRRPPRRRESRGLSERRLLEPPACAFGKERAFRLKCDWLSLGTTDENQEAGVLFRSHFATISSIGSVADSSRRASDRLLLASDRLERRSTGPMWRVSARAGVASGR